MLTRPVLDNFAIYTNIKLLCCTPKTNIKLCQLHLNKKKKNKVEVILLPSMIL